MIIGVCGFAGSGKDTFADYLVNNHGFKKTSFAAPLKQMAKIAFDFSDEQLWGPSSLREKEDTRYLFTGNCPHCQIPCVDLRHRDYQGTHEARQGAWWCAGCDSVYQKYVTPRLALQTLGTEWGRTLYSNIWVDACLASIKEEIRNGGSPDWVIPDCRFRNEIEGIQDAGGVVVRLLRGELRYTHASEAELAEVDLEVFEKVIDNQGTIEDFYGSIERALPQLRYLGNEA